MNGINTITYPLSFTAPKGRWYSLKIHFASLFIVILIAWLSGNSALTLLIGGSISFLTYFYIGFLEAKKSPVYLSPLSYYFFWFSVGLGLSAIYYGTIVLDSGRVLFSTATINYNSLIPAYIIFLTSSFCFHAGLHLFRPKLSENKPVVKNPTLNAIIILALVGLFYQLFTEHLSIIGGIINFFRYGLLAAVSSIAVTKPERLGLSNKIQFILILAGCAGLFLLNISSTSKSLMMLSFFPLVWYLLVDKKRWKFLYVLILLLIPFYFFIIYPVSYELRAQYWSGEGMNKTEAFNRILNNDKGNLVNYGFENDPVSTYLSRVFDPIALAYIYQQVELYGYASGETMKYIAYAFIPRIIWPDKPAVTQGTWFAYYIGFASSPQTSTLSLGITATGELFWNFGMYGVISGMFLLGCAFGGLWRMAGNDPRTGVVSMLLYINIMFFITGMSEAITVLIGIVTLFIAFKSLFILRSLLFNK